jgi:hypothetical protein
MTPEDHANNLEAMAQGYRDEIVDAEEGVASYPKPCRAKERAEGALRMMRLELAACEAGAAALRQRLTCARCKFWREGDSAKYDGWCEPLNRGTARAFFCGFWEEAD